MDRRLTYIAAMPESRPPIELQGLSLAELQARMEKAPPSPRSIVKTIPEAFDAVLEPGERSEVG